jgi:hypothetical protein
MAQYIEVTTSIEQIGQNIDGNFAIRTPNHAGGGWVQIAGGGEHQLAAYVLAAVAWATGRKLQITYESYDTEFPNYRNAAAVRII